MKKTLVATMMAAAMILGGSSAFAFVGTDTLVIGDLASAPTVDGARDGVYPAALNLSDPFQATTPGSTADLSGNFTTGFFGNTIFFHVAVTDDTDAAGDALDIFIDLMNIGGALPADQLAAWENDGGPAQLRIPFDGAAPVFGDAQAITATHADVGVSGAAGTTNYEVGLKVNADLYLPAFDSFGIALRVQDSDNGTTVTDQIGWQGGPQQIIGTYNAQQSTLDPEATADELGQGMIDFSLDDDGDKLLNSHEASIGTDPSERDSDGDGVSDFDEVNYDGDGGTYTPGADLNPLVKDTDGDGVDDNVELLFGVSDPLDSTSVPPDMPATSFAGMLLLVAMLLGAAVAVIAISRKGYVK